MKYRLNKQTSSFKPNVVDTLNQKIKMIDDKLNKISVPPLEHKSQVNGIVLDYNRDICKWERVIVHQT